MTRDLRRFNPVLKELSSQYIGRHLLGQLIDQDVLLNIPLSKNRKYRRYRINFGEHELDEVIEKVVG